MSALAQAISGRSLCIPLYTLFLLLHPQSIPRFRLWLQQSPLSRRSLATLNPHNHTYRRLFFPSRGTHTALPSAATLSLTSVVSATANSQTTQPPSRPHHLQSTAAAHHRCPIHPRSINTPPYSRRLTCRRLPLPLCPTPLCQSQRCRSPKHAIARRASPLRSSLFVSLWGWQRVR